MALIKEDFGFSTHDAEHVELEYRINYESGYHELEFSFDDARGNIQKIIFHDVLAFRWDHNDEHKDSEDTFEVVDSSWLQAHLNQNYGAEHSLRWKWEETTKNWSKVYNGSLGSRFAHYRLCFNALDLMLDVAARRIEGLRELRSHPPSES